MSMSIVSFYRVSPELRSGVTFLQGPSIQQTRKHDLTLSLMYNGPEPLSAQQQLETNPTARRHRRVLGENGRDMAGREKCLSASSFFFWSHCSGGRGQPVPPRLLLDWSGSAVATPQILKDSFVFGRKSQLLCCSFLMFKFTSLLKRKSMNVSGTVSVYD